MNNVSDLRIAIVAADFNQEIVDPMIAAAEETASSLGVTVNAVVRVPGSYEIPIVVQTLLQHGESDAVVVLGYIERGDTLHGQVMGHVVHQTLMNLQLEYNIPLGIGIIGPGATLDQAQTRKVPYAQAAVNAALKMAGVLEELS